MRGVLGDRARLGLLVACLVDDDPVVRMRGADALEKVCNREPRWLVPYLTFLLDQVSAIRQPSVQWHLAQILGQVPLTHEQRNRAVALLSRFLGESTDWLVLNHSLVAMAGLVRADPRLAPEFLRRLSALERDRVTSVAKRAARLRREVTASLQQEAGADQRPSHGRASLQPMVG